MSVFKTRHEAQFGALLQFHVPGQRCGIVRLAVLFKGSTWPIMCKLVELCWISLRLLFDGEMSEFEFIRKLFSDENLRERTCLAGDKYKGLCWVCNKMVDIERML